jgi:hypothetical protein
MNSEPMNPARKDRGGNRALSVGISDIHCTSESKKEESLDSHKHALKARISEDKCTGRNWITDDRGMAEQTMSNWTFGLVFYVNESYKIWA